MNETSHTAYIRICSRGGDVSSAEASLSIAEANPAVKKRNRLYLGLLTCYCLTNQSLPLALKTYKRLLAQGLAPREAEYTLLLNCATSAGSVEVANKVLNDITEDVLVPQTECREAIIAWYTSSVPRSTEAVLASYDLSPGPSHLATSQSRYAVTTAVPTESGVLSPYTTLRSVDITSDECAKLTTMNTQIAVDGSVLSHSSDFAGGGKGKKRKIKSRQERDAR